MDVDAKFLEKVQAAGWNVLRVTKTDVMASCPSASCCMKAKLSPDQPVPKIARQDGRGDLLVETYDEIRQALRSRRHDLGLSIKDVEEVAGMTADHLAKMEKDDPSREPSIFLLMCWLEALGFDVVLRAKPMPRVTLKAIEETRGIQDRRRKIVSASRSRQTAKLG
jgi:transcriptional regulator with XRE-family HTH domain